MIYIDNNFYLNPINIRIEVRRRKKKKKKKNLNHLSLLQKRAVRTPSSIHVYRKVLGSKRAKLERIFLSRQMLARVRASRRYQAL